MSSKATLSTVLGQPSWTLSNQDVQLSVTRRGGQMAPVIFDRRKAKIAPYSIAPWHSEASAAKLIPLLEALRGDFFCLPFGANAQPYQGKNYPVHGESANSNWKFANLSRRDNTTELHLYLRTQIRRGRIDKIIRLIDGHHAVYCQHRIDVESGRMNFGYHAMLNCSETPRAATISTSRFLRGCVFPEPAEHPEDRGYSLLKPGAEFQRLDKVPTITGAFSDLSQYPERRGYDDIVQIVNEPNTTFAWSAVAFDKDRFVWFTLKDPRILTGTVLWFSNGGRHYPPWNGRHLGVLGIEEVTSYFHYGLKESVGRNPFNKLGVKTCMKFQAGRPLHVNVISGIARTPANFGRLATIEPRGPGIRLSSDAGRHVDVPIDVDFLYA